MVPKTVVIPNNIQGIPVCGIASRAFFTKDLTSLTLPSCKYFYIGSEAFAHCISLTTVTIPSSVQGVLFEDDAFFGSNLNQASRDELRRSGYRDEF